MSKYPVPGAPDEPGRDAGGVDPVMALGEIRDPARLVPLIDRLHEEGRIAAVSLGQSRQLLLHADALRELEERVVTVMSKVPKLVAWSALEASL